MHKTLNLYPIPTGEELNIFSGTDIQELTIKDMNGNVVYEGKNLHGSHNRIDITPLARDTYIVEAVFIDQKTSRSLFVKL